MWNYEMDQQFPELLQRPRTQLWDLDWRQQGGVGAVSVEASRPLVTVLFLVQPLRDALSASRSEETCLLQHGLVLGLLIATWSGEDLLRRRCDYC